MRLKIVGGGEQKEELLTLISSLVLKEILCLYIGLVSRSKGYLYTFAMKSPNRMIHRYLYELQRKI